MLSLVLLQAPSEHSSGWSSFWGSLPGLLWFGLVLLALFTYRHEIRDFVQTVGLRLKSGASVKILSVEIGPVYVATTGATVDNRFIQSRVDDERDPSKTRYEERKQYSEPVRKIFLVHRLSPSKQPKQLYDVLAFLKAGKGASLLDVEKVEYYFGKHWGNRIFTSTNKWNSFAIGTSAYGPFLCTAHVFFNDGYVAKTWRYIDFEMGSVGDLRADEEMARATAGSEH